MTMEMQDLKDISKCPFHNGTLGNEKPVSTETNGVGNQNEDWWPDRLTLDVLRQHSPLSDPMGESFEYKKEFESLDLASVKKELAELMTDSQDWWPADFGHYGPFFIRMAWHSAGTYRVNDCRVGTVHEHEIFASLKGEDDKDNMDKAGRL